ncbi:MAG: hypothetical protein HGB34_00700 [Candidatus Moranbacteria bacterium]|jgi:hypothetical protein|nr:hypothetical protein [Candidatus Moranbacteria bacterium]
MKRLPRVTVTADIPPDLSASLETSGITIGSIPIGCLVRSRSARNGLIIRLPEIRTRNTDPGAMRFRLIEELKGTVFRLNCAEYRRGETFASVVCGLSGKRLLPYWEKKTGSPLPVDAWFSATDALVTTSYDAETGLIRVAKRKMTQAEDGSLVIRVLKEPLFEGLEIPRELDRYREAAETAFRKVMEPAPFRNRIRYFADRKARR